MRSKYVKKEKPAPIFDILRLEKELEELKQNFRENELVIREMRKMVKKYRDLIENVSDWVWEVDENARFTFVNLQIKRILGYEPKEIIGKTRFELMSKEDAERSAKRYVQIVSEKKPFHNFMTMNIHKEGHLVCLETNGTPIFDESGAFKGFRGISREITESKIK